MNYDLQEYYSEEMEAFSIWMKQSGFTDSTQKEYMSDICRFFKYLGETDLEKVGKLQIMGFLTSLRKTNGDKSRNRILSSLRSFFKALITFEMIAKNPALDVTKSKTEKNRMPVYLEEDDLIKALSFINGKYKNRDTGIFLLMSYAGLRVGEVNRLNIKDFNMKNGTVRILGKGRKWNELPLPELLLNHLKLVYEERITPSSSKEDALFISQKKRRLSVKMIQKTSNHIFAEFKKENPHFEGQPLSCHKLRHSFATMLLQKEVDIRVVKELMGHVSIETTMIYTHINDEQKRVAMNKINIPKLGIVKEIEYNVHT